MALRLFQKKDKTINLILTDDAIRFVAIRQTEPLVVEKYEERELPEGLVVRGLIENFDELKNILENCIDEWKISKKDVRFTVPDRFVAIREEKVDLDLQPDEIKNQIFMQIGSTIHLPFNEPVFDIVVTGQDNKKQIVLIVAAPEETVQDYVDVFAHCGLKPTTVDVEPLCVYRLFYHYGKTNPEAHEIIVHLKSDVLTVSVFHQNQPKFMKPIFILDTQTVSENIEDAGGLLEALSELEKVINFYENSVHKGEVQVETIFFTGHHPKKDFVEQYIKQTFDIPVHTDTEITIQTKENELLPLAFYVAAGLGLKDG